MFGFQFDQPRDKWVSWYAVDLPHVGPYGKYLNDKAGYEKAKAERKANREILKQHGYSEKTLRFHYRDVDDKAKVRAEKKAKALCEYIRKTLKVKVEVQNGSYL